MAMVVADNYENMFHTKMIVYFGFPVATLRSSLLLLITCPVPCGFDSGYLGASREFQQDRLFDHSSPLSIFPQYQYPSLTSRPDAELHIVYMRTLLSHVYSYSTSSP